MRERAEYILLESAGSNALDFHIAYYLGILTTADPTAYFHIISKDTGFDPLIAHLNAQKIHISRSNSIDEMPCFNQQKNNTLNAKTIAVASVVPIKTVAKPPEQIVLEAALNHLTKQKLAKPSSKKTLLNTLQSITRNDPLIKPELVLQQLLKAGYIRIDNNDKITYKLPVSL